MRKTALITVDADGRDKGKTFKLTEMSATAAEDWAARVINGMARSGVDIPEDIANAGLAGVAAVGIRALIGMSFTEARPLLNEMFYCVQIIPDPARPNVARALIEDDIEEIATRIQLRKEVLALHLDFSKVADLLKSTQAATADSEGPST